MRLAGGLQVRKHAVPRNGIVGPDAIDGEDGAGGTQGGGAIQRVGAGCTSLVKPSGKRPTHPHHRSRLLHRGRPTTASKESSPFKKERWESLNVHLRH